MYFPFSPSPPSTSYSVSPMEIPSSSRSKTQSPSCAYPSWPTGSSLSRSGCGVSKSTSFIISDEELFPTVFDDSEQDRTPPATPNSCRSPASPSTMCEPRVVVEDDGAFMRNLVAEDKARKERRRRRSSSKKSRSGSGASKRMSPILE